MTALRILAPLMRPLLWLLAALGLYGKLRSDAKAKEDLKDARDHAATRKAMDDADLVGNDPDAARRFLHERNRDQR